MNHRRNLQEPKSSLIRTLKIPSRLEIIQTFLREIVNVWSIVFRQPAYLLLMLVIAVGFYLMNVLIANMDSIFAWSKTLGVGGLLMFILHLTLGFHQTITSLTFFALIFIGVATGMLFSLMVCKFRMIHRAEKNAGFISGTAVFLAFFVPGCASCGVGLAALLGFGSSIASLPFEGGEISIIAFTFLIFAIFKVSNEFSKCTLMKRK